MHRKTSLVFAVGLMAFTLPVATGFSDETLPPNDGLVVVKSGAFISKPTCDMGMNSQPKIYLYPIENAYALASNRKERTDRIWTEEKADGWVVKITPAMQTDDALNKVAVIVDCAKKRR